MDAARGDDGRGNVCPSLNARMCDTCQLVLVIQPYLQLEETEREQV